MIQRATFGSDVLGLFEVIWVFDRTTRPPKSKMVVCLSYTEGWFLRVNTSGRFRPCIAIDKKRNPWLDHDSHVECTLLQFDEFEIEESLRDWKNPVGTLHLDHKALILKALLGERYINRSDKAALVALLG